MKITIIETGLPPAAIRADWPDYPAMFAALLSPVGDFAFEAASVVQGAPFPDPASLDAVLITGSAAGVYEDHPWMATLMDFIRWCAAENTPQIGVCFGHQAIAQALGGQVIQSPKSWGLGRHTYSVEHRPSWMPEETGETLSLAVSHKDQVVVPPPGAQTLLASDFTPYAGLVYAQGPAISVQGHPEFSADFSRALYGARKGNPLTEADVAAAGESLEEPLDAELVARWMAGFLAAHCEGEPPA